MMKKLLTALSLAGAMLASLPASAAPTVIDFDDLPAGTVVGASYAGLGVTFVDAETATFGTLPGGTSPNAIVHDTLFSTFGPANSIVAIFAFAVDSVSLTGVDVGGAGFLMTAYDSVVGGSVVDTDSFTGVDIGVGAFHTLTLTGSGIRRIEFSQVAPCCGDGLAFDNLVFDAAAVPAPGTAALLALGLIASGVASRRRR